MDKATGWIFLAAFAAAVASSGEPDGPIREFSFMAANLAGVLACFYVVLGFPALHALARRTRCKPCILVPFYLLLIYPAFTFPMLGLVVIIGLIDLWADFRRPMGQESVT
jgi:hypothetical protein